MVKNLNVTEQGDVMSILSPHISLQGSKATEMQKSKITTYFCILVA